MEDAPKKRGRGRPVGSKNKNTETPRDVPPGIAPMEDYRAPDPLTLVARQYAMVDWQQQGIRNELKVGLGAPEGIRANGDAGLKLVDVGNALMKTLENHKRALALTEELAKHKSPLEMLEIAIKKCEAQDLPTLEAIIKRLRKRRATLAPTSKSEAMRMGDNTPAAAAMASLDDMEDV